jgi:hypothetical protein
MKAISIQLDADRFDKNGNRQSLGALLEDAVKVTRPALADEREIRREATWISRWAIRAVCEEIIRRREITLPLAVRFTSAAESQVEENKVISFPL